VEDGRSVDVEGLRVEGESPEVVFARRGGGCGCGKEAGGGVGLDLVARARRVVEVYGKGLECAA
jgi:hypothetical protein